MTLEQIKREQEQAMASDKALRPDSWWRHYGCGNVRGGRCCRCGERLGTKPPTGARTG